MISEMTTFISLQIGEQIWMAENLKYLPMVSPSIDGSGDEPYYYVHGYQGVDVEQAKAMNNFMIYGVLYNFSAGEISCPKGWHLPSDDEWIEIEVFLGMNLKEANKINANRLSGDVGKKMKTTSGWNDLNNGKDGNGTNSSGLCVLPGGGRYSSGRFGALGDGVGLVSHSQYAWSGAMPRGIWSSSDGVIRIEYYRSAGFSVRCIKDE